jgi:UDP-2,3-diacylglucosamine hydrolase
MYYFASDMHLGLEYPGGSRERELAVVRWLEEVSADADAIFLVGDVFDFWFEYKRVVPKGFTRLLGKLSELTDRGVHIHFFTGNHDMWAYSYLNEECGVIIHDRAEMFELYGKQVFVAHGDGLYLQPPTAIKIMNKAFHSKFLRRAFAALVHPNLALRFGNWWSHKSRKSKMIAHPFRGDREYLVQYAHEYMKAIHVDYFVFGHLHVAENYDLGDGCRAIFLGEWIEHPTYAVMNEDGTIELKAYLQS